MKKKKIMIILILFFFLLGIIFFLITKMNEDKQTLIAHDDIISRQKRVDDQIGDYLKNSHYTLKNPKVLVNPYELSPLTALVVFTSEKKESIKVYVNGEYFITTTEDTSHRIPIMGLLANQDNEISLKTKSDENNFNIHPLIDSTILTNLNINKEGNDKTKYYFTSSSTSNLLYSAFNYQGKLAWYLDIASQGMIEPLDNGNFLIGVPEYTTNKMASFTGIYEVNYLGKIIKRYDSLFGYHHAIKYLGNDIVMLAGSSNDPKTPAMSIIYRLDLNTGKIIDYLDVHEVFKLYDPNWEEYATNLEYGYGVNSFDFHEQSQELLISFRCLNVILSLNYVTKELNWIYTNPLDFPDVFAPYFLKSDFLYPHGQHDVSRIDANTFSFYNNDFDEKNMMNSKVSTYIPNQAGAYIMKIDNMTLSLQEAFLEPTDKFSYALGGFSSENNNFLVTYSYLFYDEKKDITLFDFQENTYSKIIEYNKDGEIIFDANIPDRLYQTKLQEFPKKTDNLWEEYKSYNNFDDLILIDYEALKKAEKHENILTIYKNHTHINLSDEFIKNLYIIFDGEKDFIYPYRGTDIYYQMPEDTYDVYIYLNKKHYNLNTRIKI